MRVAFLQNLSCVPYADALALQHRLVDARKRGHGEDTVLLLEHPPVFTLGRNADEQHILASRDFLDAVGIEIHRAERGGDVTYHGPGQLVGYPILDLRNFRMDVGWYVRALEDVLIQTINSYGLDARRAGLGDDGKRDAKLVGVWVENPTDVPQERKIFPEAKIAQIGVRIEGWVTYHGFALNVDPNMEHFRYIVPCGIPDKPVTSLARALKQKVSLDDARGRVARAFERVFDVSLTETSMAGNTTSTDV